MATLKIKSIKDMNEESREKKLKELRLELVKSKVNASKTGNSKSKELRKVIARILTFNTSEDKNRNMLKSK